jgi:hypothetical protein
VDRTLSVCKRDRRGPQDAVSSGSGSAGLTRRLPRGLVVRFARRIEGSCRLTRPIVLCGFAAVGAFALVAVLAVTAIAQAAPVRIVRGNDGTLYLVQEGKSWTLVPDPISDSDLATLTSRGKFDGAIPAQFPGCRSTSGQMRRRLRRLHTDVLTDIARADILAAVDRGNAAWTPPSCHLTLLICRVASRDWN